MRAVSGPTVSHEAAKYEPVKGATISNFLVLCLNYSCLLLILMLAILAMLGDGTIKLDFNRYSEGWVEIGLLSVAALLMPAIIWKIIKKG